MNAKPVQIQDLFGDEYYIIAAALPYGREYVKNCCAYEVKM
jgi:hypothetical protein